VATSLNSSECFVLQSGTSIFSWHGNQSSFEQQQLATKVAEFLKPGSIIKHTKEGTESSSFWFPLGGKQSYAGKKAVPEVVRDPHLFEISINKGKFQVEEIYNFSQDDLLTEDVLILDTHAEVFVWIGQSSDSKNKQNAFEIGQKYTELAASLEGLAQNVPLYKVTEGNEPSFFTTYFSWDPAKATVHGNSFQKKVLQILGASHVVEEKSNGANQGGPTQRASALAALNTAFTSSSSPKHGSAPRSTGKSQGSQRAAAVAALSSVLTAEKEKKNSPDPSPARLRRTTPAEASPPAPSKIEEIPEVEDIKEISEVKEIKEVIEVKENKEASEVKDTETVDLVPESNGKVVVIESKPDIVEDENDSETTQSVFSYDRLRAKSDNPVKGIDFKRREVRQVHRSSDFTNLYLLNAIPVLINILYSQAYLSDEEFVSVLGMPKDAFNKLPKWKQDMLKRKVDLF
ncbi:hypothetical protein M569_13669, partial [Genlisea aurea]